MSRVTKGIKILKTIDKVNCPMFSDLQVGEIYRRYSGQNLYIKAISRNEGYVSVQLTGDGAGNIYTFESDYSVYKVELEATVTMVNP